MNLKLLIFAMVLSGLVQVDAQHVIGLYKEEVENVIKKEYRDFSLDKTIVKQQFNYLKYVNGSGTKTFIIYFNDEDIARSAKMVCDYAEYDFIRDELDEQFEKTEKNQWAYRVGRDDFIVTLTEQDWYFTVRYMKSE